MKERYKRKRDYYASQVVTLTRELEKFRKAESDKKTLEASPYWYVTVSAYENYTEFLKKNPKRNTEFAIGEEGGEKIRKAMLGIWINNP